MEHTFPIQGIKTKHTTEQDNWEEISFLLGESVLSFYFCYFSLFFPFFLLIVTLSIATHCLSRCWSGMFAGTFEEFPGGRGRSFKPFTADFFLKFYRIHSQLWTFFLSNDIHWVSRVSACGAHVHSCTHARRYLISSESVA